MTQETDTQLIGDYLKGNEPSLGLLFSRYLKPVYNFILHTVGSKVDAEDITQDVFLRVWKNLKKYNPQKSFKTWIFSIARNATFDFLKKKKTIPFSDFTDDEGKNPLDDLSDTTPLPDELFEREDLAQTLEKALQKLSPESRMVLLLHYQNGMTFREIAESLNQSVDTIKSRHLRALVKLRELLRNQE